ncbi:MAG: LPS biosynthesis glycosyltransferase [Methylotenera sp.]|nr:MAG: LPS biosynthesis glycosyltransferase [Methylotenera sp.]PPD11408.1 MAG: LPS biosynthesis glycosyltransferase [Methylotenera sp.]
MHNTHPLTNYFDCIYIINLLERLDRRAEMEEQLNKINLSLTHPKIHLFSAVKPDSAGEFDSIGARGCFMSHLGILKHAKSHQYQKILVLEDDLNFTSDFSSRIDQVIDALSKHDWALFYGGYLGLNGLSNESNQGVINISPLVTFHASHFIAFQGQAIADLVDYLSLLITRKGGDPRGGPMHVDGAYYNFRVKGSKTFIAFPELGYQRASRTDIHVLSWQDKLPVFRHVLCYLRKVKNKLAKK